MEYIQVTKENIAKEHICCAITDKKGETGVANKKAWLTERFDEGLTFLKLNERGKVFIEYLPAENAWVPIAANGYMFIDCFWVSGRFAGHGHGKELLNRCMADAKAKGFKGLVAVSSAKKMSFLSDPGFYKKFGFTLADTAPLYYELLYLPFDKNAEVPKFKDCVKTGEIADKGMVVYYTDQCPHTGKYVKVIVDMAKEAGQEVKAVKITSKEQAQNAPCVFTTYSFFDNGKFLTNEIFGPSKFTKHLQNRSQ